ncbi:MAG: hypothetical protein H6604_00125 [Flavobacteriales bacterium]|nr:hypothetical protein [Flavobacteriales bacterium]
MNFRLLLASILSVVSLFVQAQIQDLANLAEGDLVDFRPLYKEEDLYGYFALYSYGEVEEGKDKYEYHILDKNLNPVANKDFLSDSQVYKYVSYMNSKGEIIMKPKFNFNKNKAFPKTKRILVDKNEIVDKDFQCYENGEFSDCPDDETWKQNKKDDKKELKEKGYNYNSYVVELKNGNYLVFDEQKHKSFLKNQNIVMYDKDKKELWRKTYGTHSDKKYDEDYDFFYHDDEFLYLTHEIRNKTAVSTYLEVYDMKLGEQVAKVFYSDRKDDIATPIEYEDNENQFILLSLKQTLKRFYTDKGFSRLVFDKIKKEISIDYVWYNSDFSKFIKIKDNALLEKGYYSIPRDYIIFNDGRVVILNEKSKVGYSNFKTTDLVIFHLDKDFNVEKVDVQEKEKTKSYYYGSSDYLFSQHLNDGKDAVFFYRDKQKDEETKEKNWNLFINTIIDGKLKQEVIKMSSEEDKYYISPYPAKEGYILLREYNKKDKYNQIRLEKLNL